MTLEEVSEIVTLGAFFAATGTVFLFLVLYLTLARWETHPMGRHLLAFTASTLAVLIQSMVNFFSPGYPGQIIIRPILLWLFVAVWVWRIVLFLKDQRVSRRLLKEEEEYNVRNTPGTG